MCIEAEELARMHSHKFSLFLPMTTGSFIFANDNGFLYLCHFARQDYIVPFFVAEISTYGRNIQNGEVL